MTEALKRVLIVEDERIVGEHIRLSLKAHGYDVPYVLNSGEKAIELLKTESFDLIYMDIMLDGELDGIETASIIGKKYSVPVVFLTAYNNIATIDRAKETNPYGYLIKPFEDADLRTTTIIAIHKAETERELNETQSWLSSIISSMDEGVTALDSQGHIMFYNEPAGKILQIKEKNIIGKNFLDVIPFENEKQRSEADEIFKSIEQNRKFIRNQSNPYRLKLKSAEIMLDITATAMVKDSENKSGAVVVFRDITDIDAMNQTLRRSEERLRSIIESTSEGLVLLDEKGYVVEFNQGAEHILNESNKNVIGQPLWRTIPELMRDDNIHYTDDGSIGQKVFSAIKNEDMMTEFPEKEKNFRRSDGIWKRLKIRMFTTKTSSQTYLGISIKDLSDTSLSRIQFLKDNDRFNSSFEEYPAPLFLSDSHAHSFLFNKSAWKLLGYSGPIRTLSEVELFGKSKPITARLEDIKHAEVLDYQNITLITSKYGKRESMITIVAQFDLENKLSGLRGLVH